MEGADVAVALLAAGCDGGGNGLPPGSGRCRRARAGWHDATAGLARDPGALDLVSGATTVAVRTADLGPDRVRATTPDGAGVAPVLDVQGDTVTVHLVRTGQPGPTEFTVHVPTGVRIDGGAASADVDGVRRTGLAGGTVLSTSMATDRYDVNATAGGSTLVLDRT